MSSATDARPRQRLTLLIVAGFLAIPQGFAAPRSTLIDDLKERLARGGVASVNAHLSSHWETQMAELGRMVRACQPDAMALTVNLLDTSNVEALEAHAYSLELAMGECPGSLLPLVPLRHVPRLCSVAAFEDQHPGADLVRELRRRIAQLEQEHFPVESEGVKACQASYARAMQEPR